MTAKVATEIQRMLHWFIENGEKYMTIDIYPNKEKFCETVAAKTFARVLYGLFVKKTGNTTNCKDIYDEPYPIYQHLLLTYALGCTNKPDNAWLALSIVYNDNELIRRIFNVNTREYKNGIGLGQSATEVRDEINRMAKPQIQKAAKNLNAEGQANILKSWIELYISNVYTYKNHQIIPRKVNIKNFFSNKQ